MRINAQVITIEEIWPHAAETDVLQDGHFSGFSRIYAAEGKNIIRVP